jgi:Alginate lyase
MSERVIYPVPGEDIIVQAPKGGRLSHNYDKTHTRIRVKNDAPVVEPPPDPDPDPEPAGRFLIIDRARLLELPTSGRAWDNLRSWASQTATPNIADQDDKSDTRTLAKALSAVRTDTGLDEVRSILARVPGTERGGRTLALGRGLGAYVLAADLVGYRDPAFVAWVDSVRTETLDGRTLISTHEVRPNNWGTHAGASRIAADLYLGDEDDLERAATVFRGWLGERDRYAGFKYGDLSWQADPAHPVGVNPFRATRDGFDLDGVLPDDLRRGGSFPTIGAAGISYTWEAMQGVMLATLLLRRNGYPNVILWADAAVRRAYARSDRLATPTSDDEWQPWVANELFGDGYPAKFGATPGKGFGFTDWLFG